MRTIRPIGFVCALTMLIMFPAPVSALPPTSSVPVQLRILTYNVHTVVGAPGVAERVALIVQQEVLSGYDALILTELFRDAPSRALLDALRDEYPYQTPVLGRDAPVDINCDDNTCWNNSTGCMDATQVEDGGVAVVSKWPILVRQQYVFSVRCGIDALARKGFVYVQIDLDGSIVHIIGTHLQADPPLDPALTTPIEQLVACPEPPPPPNPGMCPVEWTTARQAVRLHQLAEIDAWIAEQDIPADQMVLIGGDLNIDKEGTPVQYAQMLCFLRVNAPAYRGDPALGPPWYTFDGAHNALLGPGAGRLYIDYVLVRNGFAQPAQWQNHVLHLTAFPDNWDQGTPRGYELSDHFPVLGYVAAP